MPTTRQWSLTEPKILDVGDVGERVERLTVTVVGGRVDVVTHDDSPAARVEVSTVEGPPLSVGWDGRSLTVTHGTSFDVGLLDRLRENLGMLDRARVHLTVSVPAGAATTVTTVSAAALVAGVHAPVKVRTVSGSLTLDDTVGTVNVGTVSGNVDARRLHGPLEVSSVSGSVTAHRSDLPEVGVKTVNGDVTLDLVTGRCSVAGTSVAGTLTLRSPATGWDVEVATLGGTVVVDGHTVPRHGRTARARSGDGGLRVRSSSASGDVVLLGPAPPPATDGADATSAPAV